MEKPEGLIPVKITSRYVQSTTVMGRLIRQDLIVTDKNQTVCSDLPPSWMEYIKNAINGFASAQEYKRNDVPISTGILYSAKIPGLPVAMSDGKQIKQDNDGNFTLSASKEYARRIRQVMKMKMELTYGFSNKPIDYPVHIKCQFYSNKRNVKLCVPEQVTAMLDLLKRLGIIKSTTSEVVARTDGSECAYVLGEAYTFVTIRKMREEE